MFHILITVSPLLPTLYIKLVIVMHTIQEMEAVIENKGEGVASCLATVKAGLSEQGACPLVPGV